MKTRNLIVTGFLLIAGGLSMSVSAQETIKALVEKCKTMENMDVNVLRSKNKETKKVEKEVVSIRFKNNETLLKEFVAAFNKDKDAANQELEYTVNGSKELNYRFDNVSCSLSQDGKGGVTVSIIQDDKIYKYESISEMKHKEKELKALNAELKSKEAELNANKNANK
jgi:uncharacterized protein (DUF3084 family)